MMDWGASWIMMGLGMIGMVLFWGLVIFGIVWIVRTAAGDNRRGSEHHETTHERSPIDVLDRSLAEGTIDVEDYKERRRVLTGST